MTGVKFIAKRLLQWIEESNKKGHCVQFFLVYTDKPVRKVIKNIIAWDKLNEAICYQKIMM